MWTPLPERPLRAAARGALIESVPEGGEVPLPALSSEFPASPPLGLLELLLGCLLRLGLLRDLGAQGRHPRADVRVGEALEFGLEGVDLVDEALEALDLALVGVHETVEDAEHGKGQYRRAGLGPSGGG